MRIAVLIAVYLSVVFITCEAWPRRGGRWGKRWEQDEDEDSWDDEEDSWAPDGDHEGELCRPPGDRRPCGDPEIIEIKEEECGVDFGPNVCTFELTFEMQTVVFEYQRRCFFGGRGCVSMCTCTGRCEGEVMMMTRHFIDCCTNFTTTPFIEYAIESMEEGREFRPPNRLTMLRNDGCPVEIIENCPEDATADPWTTEEPEETEAPDTDAPGDTEAPGTTAPPFVPPNFTDDPAPESG